MLPLPSREALATLTQAAHAIVPIQSFGFVTSLDDARLSMFFVHPNGMSQHVVQRIDVPTVLRPSIEEGRQEETTWIGANPEAAVEWLLSLGNVRRLVSVPVPGIDPVIRGWFGFSSTDALTQEQIHALESTLGESRHLLWPATSSHEAGMQLQRLEEAAQLLPALLHVLDVREVFDRLSVNAKRALPHDLLLLRVFSEDLSQLTTYASSDRGKSVGVTVPQVYPAAVARSWQFDIVDDLATHPVERNQSPVKMGARSTLRIPIWFGSRVIGG